MNEYRIADPLTLRDPFIGSVGKDWMLVTVRTPDGRTNPMTASWGGVGYLWNKPIFWCVLRPQRYTHELAQLSNAISLSFYGEEMRPALSYCGSHSGRDGDKASAAGLELCLDGDFAYYRGARMILMGRKCYVGQLKKEDFINMEIPKQCYPGDDYHFVYVCEIEKALLRN